MAGTAVAKAAKKRTKVPPVPEPADDKDRLVLHVSKRQKALVTEAAQSLSAAMGGAPVTQVTSAKMAVARGYTLDAKGVPTLRDIHPSMVEHEEAGGSVSERIFVPKVPETKAHIAALAKSMRVGAARVHPQEAARSALLRGLMIDPDTGKAVLRPAA